MTADELYEMRMDEARQDAADEERAEYEEWLAESEPLDMEAEREWESMQR